MTTSIARRLLVGAALMGAALSTTAGHAGTPPTLVATSVDSGFSGLTPIAARFNATLDAGLSIGELRDKDGTVVGSSTIRTSSGMGPDGDSLVLTAAHTALRETLSPYTVTFTAVEATASAPPGATAISRTFFLDAERPLVATTAPPGSAAPGAVAPGTAFVLSGHAYDGTSYDTVAGAQVARTANRSGLARVEVQFYRLNPTVRPPSVNPGTPPTVSTDPPGVTPGNAPTVVPPVIQPSQEVGALRHNATLSNCTRGADCADGEKAWTATTTGLTTGSWTARVYSVDLAGNRSAVSETSFLIA